jgi:hypothetical protein
MGQTISLATNDLSPNEAKAIFKRVVGSDMPTTYRFVGSLLRYFLYEQLGAMFNWFVQVGFGADPKQYKERYGMQGFERRLRESSAWRETARQRS